jgi:hypothetical protein
LADPAVIGIQALAPASCVLILLIAGFPISRPPDDEVGSKNEYIAIRDSHKEFPILLENKNWDRWKNRIMKSISPSQRAQQDRPGHPLQRRASSLNSILQTGAMMATCTDEATAARLVCPQGNAGAGWRTVRTASTTCTMNLVPLHGDQALCDIFDFCGHRDGVRQGQQPGQKVKYTCCRWLRRGCPTLSAILTDTGHGTGYGAPALYQLVIKITARKRSRAATGSV